MKNDFERDFNLGGSIERAVSGQYELKAGAIFQEAWKQTMKHFMSFSPAIIALIFVQLGIFYVALKLQLGDPGVILQAFQDPSLLDERIFQAIFVANFSYEVVSAPFYASVSLMAMSHACGLSTKPRHIAKGLQFTVPIIIATLASLLLQGVIGMLLPFISMYLSLAFSQSILLICEKRIPPMQSLLLSLRAVNKKIFVLAGIYTLMMLMFVVGAMFYGLGLIFVLPFFFHVKGIIYREMFGVKLQVTASQDNDFDDHQGNPPSGENDKPNKNPEVFDA